MSDTTTPTPEDLLGNPKTARYQGGPDAAWSIWSHRRQPIFSRRQHVVDMTTDPRVIFGLWVIKGPIHSKAKIFVRTKDAQVKEFLVSNITRFWRNSCIRALKAFEWGYSCSEALYKYDRHEGVINFHGLKDLHPLDCQPITRKSDGSLIGATVNRVIGKKNNTAVILGPRCFWHIQGREHDPWFGRSRCFGAFKPWLESVTDGGYYQSRSLFYRRQAFDGGTLFFPEGTTLDSSGNEVSNRDLARQMMDLKRNGSSLCLPSGTTNITGKPDWYLEPPNVSGAPGDFHQYGDILKDEIWEGMGIPPEVARAEGTGAYAGRFIPQQAFYAVLQEGLSWLITDMDEQILRPLVKLNFGDVEYELQAFSLLDEEDKEDQGGALSFDALNQQRAASGQPLSGAKLADDEVERILSLRKDEFVLFRPSNGVRFRLVA